MARRSAAALGIGGGVTVVLQGSAVLAALALAIPRVTAGELAPVWLAVVALVPLALFEVIGALPASALALQRLRGSAQRVAELDDLPDPVPVPTAPVALPAGFDSLRLVDLAASWDAGREVLSGVSLEVRAGERVALVGPSGSGKSTLVSVLCGFLGYQGAFTVNGVEVSSVDGDDLRHRIGVLSQRAHVFDTTIAENVRLGRPEVSEAQVWDALERAQFAAAVRAMPTGLDTEVGTFGTWLSGGEAQRLALARFLVSPPQVLIVDEPTEHLDARTAAALGDTLRQVTAGLTVIEVTHRLRTLQPDDRVLVMDAGRIVADERAGELAERPGWFAERLRVERQEADLAALIASLPVGTAVARPRPHRP